MSLSHTGLQPGDTATLKITNNRFNGFREEVSPSALTLPKKLKPLKRLGVDSVPRSPG